MDHKSSIAKDPEYFVTKPTAFTQFMRTFIPWQLLRFIVFNLKMIRMIGLSHAKKLD